MVILILGMERVWYTMKMIYKILLLSVLGFSLCFARTSGKFATPDDFLNSKNSPNTIDCNFATTDPIAKFLDPNLFSSS